MARLPKVGGDTGNWGTILNDYLDQSHNDDGTLKTDTVGAPQLKSNSVTGAAIANGSISNAKIADGAVNTAQLADDAVTASKLQGAGQANGIATLDPDGRIPEAQMPERLGEEELRAAIAQASPGSRSGMDIFFAGVTQRETRVISIVGAGSSTMEGTGASYPATSFFSLVVTAMQQAFPLASNAPRPGIRTLADAVASPPSVAVDDG